MPTTYSIEFDHTDEKTPLEFRGERVHIAQFLKWLQRVDGVSNVRMCGYKDISGQEFVIGVKDEFRNRRV